jgi:nitrite reductase/ring-hydroxylating ferredoxin subunit
MATFPKKGLFILESDELADGESKTFALVDGEERHPCFVVRWRGDLQAFVNRCRHIPMTMDWVENQFLTEDGEFILCPTHGALFQPDTGACVGGPAYGKALFRVPLVNRDEKVFAQWPSFDEDD